MGVIIEFIKFVDGSTEPVVVYRTAPYSEVDALVQIEDMSADMKERGAVGYRLVEQDGTVRPTEMFEAHA